MSEALDRLVRLGVLAAYVVEDTSYGESVRLTFPGGTVLEVTADAHDEDRGPPTATLSFDLVTEA